MPQFEDSEKTFYAIIILLSYWFCNGRIPSREAIKKLSRSDFTVNPNTVDWPDVEGLFKDGHWLSLMKSLLEKVELRTIERENFLIVVAINRSIPHKFLPGRFGHIVLPRRLVDFGLKA